MPNTILNMNKKKESTLSAKQKAFIKVFSEKAGCNISVTCKKIKIERRTYYNWLDSNAEFKALIEDAQESLIDYAETKLHQSIMDGNLTATIFYLKTKGKNRGYIETQEQNLNINPFEELMKSLPEIPDK